MWQWPFGCRVPEECLNWAPGQAGICNFSKFIISVSSMDSAIFSVIFMDTDLLYSVIDLNKERQSFWVYYTDMWSIIAQKFLSLLYMLVVIFGCFYLFVHNLYDHLDGGINKGKNRGRKCVVCTAISWNTLFIHHVILNLHHLKSRSIFIFCQCNL